MSPSLKWQVIVRVMLRGHRGALLLKMNNARFYAGQTRELREGLMEHRDGTTKSTAGKEPKLVWFSTVSTREQATELEAQLKELCNRNPREIRRRVRKFQDLV